MRKMALVTPLIQKLLRRRRRTKETQRPRRISYLWANMVRVEDEEEDEKTPVIEG